MSTLQGISVQYTKEKGNLLVAERDFDVGEQVLAEDALLAASWHEFRCIENCEKVHKSKDCPVAIEKYPADWMENITEMESILKDLPGVDELDRARTLIKYVHAIENNDTTLVKLLESLTAAKPERNAEAAKEIATNPITSCLVRVVGEEKVAKALGVLNTNCHELENVGGSGLFPSACLCEHSCAATCSFSTQATHITLVAIKPIKKGDHISLDYGNFYYDPVLERSESLRQAYDFECVCPACTVNPDRTRTFRCPTLKSNPPMEGLPAESDIEARARWIVNWATNSSANPLTSLPEKQGMFDEPHTVCPIGLGDEAWVCTNKACGYKLTSEEVAACVAEESRVAACSPCTLEEVVQVLEKGILTVEHFVLFRALESMATESLAGSSSVDELTPNHDEQIAAKIGLWNRVLMSMEAVLPAWHHEKSVFFDYLAQAYVAFGQPEKAKDAFRLAYEQSRVVCGPESSNTLQLKSMMENPPTTIEELMMAYNNIKDAADMLDYYDDNDDSEPDTKPTGVGNVQLDLD